MKGPRPTLKLCHLTWSSIYPEPDRMCPKVIRDYQDLLHFILDSTARQVVVADFFFIVVVISLVW